LSNVIDDNRFCAFTFLVVVTDAPGVGLFAFLAQLSAIFHFLQMEYIVSKMRPDGGGFAIGTPAAS
jgi:hypothetical protein